MPLAPADRSRELQCSVIAMRVVFNSHPAHLHDAIAVATNAEVNGIGSPIRRKVRAAAGVTEIAALPELLVRRCHALVSRRGAVT